MKEEKATRPGRACEHTSQVAARLTKEEHATFKAIGGSDWLRRSLREIAAGAPFSLRPKLLNEEARAAFLEGVKEEGYSVKYFPFHRGNAGAVFTATGIEPKEWGKQWARLAAAAGKLKK